MHKGMLVSYYVTCRPPGLHIGMAAFRSLYQAEALSSLFIIGVVVLQFIHSLQFETDAALASVYFKGHAVPMPLCKTGSFNGTKCPVFEFCQEEGGIIHRHLAHGSTFLGLGTKACHFLHYGTFLDKGLAHSNYLIKVSHQEPGQIY